METKVGVLDRIEQSFEIFIKEIIYLFLPLFLYNFISFLVMVFILMFVLYGGYIDFLFSNNNPAEIFSYLLNPKFIFLISVGSFIGLLYLLLNVPFVIYTYKSIKNLYEGKNIVYKENLKYGFDNFFNIMKTYRYMFVYVALLPSLIFIVGGLIFNLSYFLGLGDSLMLVGGFLMGLGGFLFLIYLIYRGLKVKFSVISAVDDNEYTKNNFNNSINLTNNKWYRILGNFILVGFIISFIYGILGRITGMVFSQDLSFLSNMEEFTKEDIYIIINNFSFLSYTISGFIDLVIKTAGTIYIMVFSYVFYKRLQFEFTNLSESNNNIKK